MGKYTKIQSKFRGNFKNVLRNVWKNCKKISKIYRRILRKFRPIIEETVGKLGKTCAEFSGKFYEFRWKVRKFHELNFSEIREKSRRKKRTRKQFVFLNFYSTRMSVD